MIDAGAMMYAAVAKDLFHVAGLYDPEDWFTIDERAQRVRGRDILECAANAAPRHYPIPGSKP